jgi:predicted glycoside hydrolase/deacetylase ChbG (UPF0249 family)
MSEPRFLIVNADDLGMTAAGPVPSSSYDAERQIELATLRHPQVKNLLNVTSVQLCSFAQANPY